MLDPDVNDGPWVSGHRLLHKNWNMTKLLFETNEQQTKNNYMNYKMS